MQEFMDSAKKKKKIIWNNANMSGIVEFLGAVLTRLIWMNQEKKSYSMQNHKALISHREFLLRNDKGKICLWKKYILLYECRKNQVEKNFWNRTLAFRVVT